MFISVLRFQSKKKTARHNFLTFIGPCIANILTEYNQQDTMLNTLLSN